MEKLAPVHPGEIFKEICNGYSITQIAKHLNVSKNSISRLFNEWCSITPKMALKLEKAIPLSSIEF